MPPLEVPEGLEEAIAKFTSVDFKDEARLENYSQVVELLSAYVRNAKSYALFPRDTKEFAESVNKAMKSLKIYLEITDFNEAFGSCAKQWRETTEHISEFVTDLMKSLDELRQRAGSTSKPVTSKEAKVKATAVKSLLTGKTLLRADEKVTIVGEAFGKAGFARVDTASGDRVVVPLIGLSSCEENAEMLTLFTSSVQKMKQCVDQIRQEVAPKFWALARSYFQSRSKQEFLFIADLRRWRAATDTLLKLDDHSTGFSFKPCINSILNNALPKKIPDAFEVSADETESLHDFIRCYQQVVHMLAQVSNSLRSVDRVWGADWQRTLVGAGSLQLHPGTPDQPQPMATRILSVSTGQSASGEFQHLQTVQQTTRRVVTTSSSQESALLTDQLLQQMSRSDVDSTDGDMHRVWSRTSSVSAESPTHGRWQVQTQRGAVPASPLPSPVIMSARMEPRESRRGIMDDFCSYEKILRDANTMTTSVAMVTESDMLQQRVQLDEARRLLARMESRRTQVTDAGCHSDSGATTSSVRVSKEAVDRLTLCHSGAPVVGSTQANMEVSFKESSAAFQQPQKPVANSAVTVGKELLDRLVRFRQEVPVKDCGAKVEIETKSNSLSFQEPVPQYMGSSISVTKVLLDKAAWFPPEKPAVKNTQASRAVESLSQSVNAAVDCKQASCRVQVPLAANAVKIRPEALNSNMMSLGKPIVDNGVFRINELIDSWTDMPLNRPTESGAHFVHATRDAKTQKYPTRPPQVECGVGDNLQVSGGGAEMAVQTTGPRGTIDCGVSGGNGDVGAETSRSGGRRRRTRGTDMSERHVICDTGACASTNRVVKMQNEELALHRPRQQSQPQPQQQQQPQQLQQQQPQSLQQQQPQPLQQQQPQPLQQQQPQPLQHKQSQPLQQQQSQPLQQQQPQPLQQQQAQPLQQQQPQPLQQQQSPSLQPQQPRPQQQPQPQPQLLQPARSRDAPDAAPDKEWRYPVNRQDFRPHPDSLSKPQLIYADTGQPLVPPSPIAGVPGTRPRQHSLQRLRKPHRTQQQQQTPPPQQQQQQQPEQRPQSAANVSRQGEPGFYRSQSTRAAQPSNRSELV